MKQYKVKQVINVTMHKSKNGNFPIGRTDEGMICFLEHGLKIKIDFGSTWECEVVIIRDKSLVVKPLNCVITAAANNFSLEQKVAKLRKEREIKVKTKYNYQYNSKNG